MLIEIKIYHRNEQEEVTNIAFESDELTSATTKALDYLKQKQDKEMVV